MKIYDKKLSNIHELRRERQLLKNRLNGNNNNNSTVSRGESPREKENLISGLLSGITSGSVLGTTLNIAPAVIDFIRKGPLRSAKTQKILPPKKAKKHFIAAVVTDFITGYIKWKIIELSYKGLKKVLKSDAARHLKDIAASKLKKKFINKN